MVPENDTARGLGIPIDNPSGAVDVLTSGAPLGIGAYKLVFTEEAGNSEVWAFEEVDIGLFEDTGRRKARASGSWYWSCFCLSKKWIYTVQAIASKIVWQPVNLAIEQNSSLLYRANALFIVMTTRGYCGGGYKMTPDANEDQGQLVFVDDVSFYRFATLMSTVKRGEHLKESECFHHALRDGDSPISIKQTGNMTDEVLRASAGWRTHRSLLTR